MLKILGQFCVDHTWLERVFMNHQIWRKKFGNVSIWIIKNWNLYINLACLSVCLFVCLFVSNKRQNGWTDRAQIFCGTSRDSREGLWIIKISYICLHQNSIVIKFLKILKIRELFLFCFTMYTKRTCLQLI